MVLTLPADSAAALPAPSSQAAKALLSLAAARAIAAAAQAAAAADVGVLPGLRLLSPAPKPPVLPNEVLLIVCEFASASSLLGMRKASRRFRSLANIELRDRTRRTVAAAETLAASLGDAVEALRREKQPHLRHYKTFLRNINMSDLTEATWYSSPPEEVKTVCECLCILRAIVPVQSPTSVVPHLAAISFESTPPAVSPSAAASTASSAGASADVTTFNWTWPAIKKHMTHYNFKNWVSNLRTNVDRIPFAAVKRVEHIIMHDPLITYERLREVSRPGYSLLIVVAACLQYGSIREEVDVKEREAASIKEKARTGRLFLSCIE
ncbi:Dynein heavy chain 10, axonemal [Entophlyctis luteolus]|nr:Dynein heavy chain 10, axonemal [Entophlyctis luteolus]